ncbi:MAG TPA: hypothetical protein DCX60_11095 [Phycisphaerales bacterium]|nr:hypothetical protein [Phycisphaerales bacterium]
MSQLILIFNWNHFMTHAKHFALNSTSHCGRALRTCLMWMALCAVLASCAGGGADPMKTLKSTNKSAATHLDAMARLDGPVPSPAYLAMLEDIVLSTRYLLPVRKAAFSRLARSAPDTLDEILMMTLNRLEPAEFRAWAIEQAGALGRERLTKAIIRSWATPLPMLEASEVRPEELALQRLTGGGKVSLSLIDTMLSASPITEANLRARCWELLVTHGEPGQLEVLVSDDDLIGGDSMMLDMRASMRELGVLPGNREEILWIRELRKPRYQTYWSNVARALAQLPDERRKDLKPRHLAVAEAAHRHRPELLVLSDQQLYELLDQEIDENGRRYKADFSGWNIEVSERLSDARKSLVWGDLAAMLLAREALRSQPFVAHVFDFADRDMVDRTTEFGGIVQLDPDGRFELLEYQPRARVADDRYLASSKLFKDGYTALYHFHNHAQKYRNERYAGPHLGDFEYADETGVNGLVFTFVDEETLNVDFYREDSFVVDLGTITRPEN